MTFIMVIWLAIGPAQVEQFHSFAECHKKLDFYVAQYQKRYVVAASGCFPRRVILQAVEVKQ